MRVGSIMGKGVVYNKKGKPILQNGEKIIKKLNEKCCVFYTKKRGFIGWGILEYGSGIIYLTNRRFIFLRSPLSWKEIVKQYGDEGYASAITYNLTAREMKAQGIMEFIEFKYNEIAEFKPGFFNSYINFFSEDRIFTVGTKKYVLDEVKKVMEKVKGE
jgi:hypothetical protein